MNAERPELSSPQFASDAVSIADRCLGSRGGVGAFRKLKDVLRRTVELITESGLFSAPFSESAGLIHDPEFWHFYGRHSPGARSRFFKDVLTTPRVYDPQCIWALFWSMAKAEHEFLFRYLPFWSNEERLTGHLISQIMERISEFGGAWRTLAANETSELEFWYADTATSRRESVTGADLGLVVHGKYGNQREFIKVIRVQAKKVASSGSAVIDLDQADTLLRKEN
jgi:hypothetical protein